MSDTEMEWKVKEANMPLPGRPTLTRVEALHLLSTENFPREGCRRCAAIRAKIGRIAEGK